MRCIFYSNFRFFFSKNILTLTKVSKPVNIRWDFSQFWELKFITATKVLHTKWPSSRDCSWLKRTIFALRLRWVSKHTQAKAKTTPLSFLIRLGIYLPYDIGALVFLTPCLCSKRTHPPIQGRWRTETLPWIISHRCGLLINAVINHCRRTSWQRPGATGLPMDSVWKVSTPKRTEPNLTITLHQHMYATDDWWEHVGTVQCREGREFKYIYTYIYV